ncbi:hypothetical protein HanIR_Chr08g0353081 [Helianthus annuus]|nr:hypothetical protein HanIR_Chr08g0353081 [Helianthus annuus]
MISLKWLQSIQLFFCKFYLLHVWVKAYVDLLVFFVEFGYYFSKYYRVVMVFITLCILYGCF